MVKRKHKEYVKIIEQLNAEISGLEMCCHILENALKVSRNASLEEISERAAHIRKLDELYKKIR